MSSFVVDFSRVDSESRLARAIGCDEALIGAVIEFNQAPPTSDEIAKDDFVRFRPPGFHATFEVPKKNHRRTHEYRAVTHVFDLALASALKALARRLDAYLRGAGIGFPTSSCFGFVAGGSTYRNAQQHLGARFLFTADIQSFFPSISAARLVSALEGARVPAVGADLIAKFATVRGSLPLGFHTSPMLSNLVCVPLDQRFESLARSRSAVYSRYADDIAFSSMEGCPTRDDVRDILVEQGFSLADDKCRETTRGQQQVVTGLSIADPSRPRIPRALKRKLRQEIFFCEKYGVEQHADAHDADASRVVNSIDGRIGYMQGIEPELGERYRTLWRQVLARDGKHAAYASTFRLRLGAEPQSENGLLLVVDEAGWDIASQRYFAVATVLVDDPPVARESFAALARSRNDDPFYGGRQERFERKGFHYSDDPERAKDDVCRMLAGLPLRATVAFAKYRDDLSFADNYLRLFAWLVTGRMRAADGESLSVVCDSHQEIKGQELADVIVKRCSLMRGKSPRELTGVHCARKGDEPLLAIPDYLLGVLGAYVTRASSDMARVEVRRFEQLRDKFRLIRDFDRHRSYNRQRQFDPSCVGVGAALGVRTSYLSPD